MKVLITGITGFVGSHLAEYLLSVGDYEVLGTYRWRSRTENIEQFKDKITLFECDLKDATAVYNLINSVKPDLIFHLASQSYVPMSWSCPSETIITNVISQVNLLEALRILKLDCKIHIAGSSEEYGLVYQNEIPIKETNPLRPLSPYGVSKVAQDLLGFQYFKSYDLQIIRTRAFNHEGPRRGEVFVTSNFAKQIAKIEKGKQEPVIYVGNLEAVRDFTDVRDVVKAYHLVLTKGKVGEVYNICSGRGYKIKEILDIYLTLTKNKIEIKVDKERLRPSDVELLIGDASKVEKETGWRASIPLEKTLKDLLDYWRARV